MYQYAWFIVTYDIPASGGCAAVGGITTSVTITAIPTAAIIYAGTPFCTSLSTPQTVIITAPELIQEVHSVLLQD